MKAIFRHIGYLVMAATLAVTAVRAQGPDLVIDEFDPPTETSPGSGIHLVTAVQNQGDQAAGASVLRYSLSPVGTPGDTTDDVVLGECQLPAVSPGGEQTCSFPGGSSGPTPGWWVVIPTDLALGEYLFFVTADADDDVIETDESNNSRSSDNGPILVTAPVLKCTAQTGILRIARRYGFAEMTSDLLLACKGGTPTPLGAAVPLTDIDLEFDTPVTSRKLNGDYLEALLLIDDPAQEDQVACPGGAVCGVTGVGAAPGVDYSSGGVPNIFQGRLVAPNRIRFSNVPVDPPGFIATRVLRIVNVRVDGNRVPPAEEPFFPATLFTTFSVSGEHSFIVDDPRQAAAFVIHSLRTSSGASANPDYDLEVTFQEAFFEAFQRRNVATSATTPGEVADQSDPSADYWTETGFYNSLLPSPLDRAGLADTGTRLLIRFEDVPPGLQILVSVEPTSASCGGSPCDLVSAVLVGFTADGTGGDPVDPVQPTQLAPAPGVVPVPIADGSGAAVYEIVETSAFQVESLTFGINLIGEGQPKITGLLAPLSSDSAASETAPIPRFFDPESPHPHTPGLYDPVSGNWFLRLSADAGVADLVYAYGPGGADWTPLTGRHWFSPGRHTPGLYYAPTGTWFLRGDHGPGEAGSVFSFGPGGLGWVPIAGDWDGDGVDTPGLYDPATGMWFLRDSNSAGPADNMFSYGPGGLGWLPLAGDWDGDGVDTAGLYDPATGIWFLRNSNSAGPADNMFSYGPGSLGWLPVTGTW